jgi:hypothetical protein
MAGTEYAGFHRAKWISLVVARRCGAGKIIDAVERPRDGQRLANVVFDKYEVSMIGERADIGKPAGVKIIDADDALPPLQQPLAKMRADEPGAPRYETCAETAVSL